MNEDIVLIIWGVVGALLAVVGLAVAGYASVKEGHLSSDDSGMFAVIVGVLLLSVLWPLWVAYGLVTAPFWAGRLAGTRAERRRDRHVEAATQERATLRELRDSFQRCEPEWGLLDTALRDKHAEISAVSAPVHA